MSDLYASALAHIPMPARVRKLPISSRGFPVPWFVEYVDGVPDFRVIRKGGIAQAIRRQLCWVCGERLGTHLAFVIGPMCSVNRISSEPAAHRECAEFAVRACPFLSRPRARRNDVDLPEHREAHPAGLMHNPGAAAVWMTKSFHVLYEHGCILLRIGLPLEVIWYAEGRLATHAEVEAAIEKGLPYLREAAARDGCLAETEAALRNIRAHYLPAAA